MAEITKYPFLLHLRSAPTAYVRHERRGGVVHEGAAQSFWFRRLSAVLSEVPVDDRELPLLFHARTADFQDVTVQAGITFRITDPGLAATRIDFAIDSRSGRWTASPLEQVATLLVESAQQHALDLLAGTTLAAALAAGVGVVRERIAAGLADDARLPEVGISVIGVRVVAIRPEPDVEKALRTPTREQVQQEADRATYERRAVAVERERAIGENELQTQIELARREEQLVAQRGSNARRQAQEAAAADAVETKARVAGERQLADAAAHRTRVVGEAQAEAEAATMAVLRDLPEATLVGLALRELAQNLPKVESLVLTPDLIAPVLARLGGRSSS